MVSIVSLPQHLLSLFPNAFSLSPRNGNSVCPSVPGFFVIGFSYIFWSQDFRDFFLSGFSSLLHLLVKSDHFNRFLTIVIIITIVLITNGYFTTVFQQCDVVLFFVLSQNAVRNHVITTPITIKMVYLLNVSLCSPKMLSEIMRWKGFLPQCGFVEFSNDSLIACLNRRKVTLVAIVWNSSPFVFSHVSSNCLLGRMQSSTGCMCLTFHRDVFLNAFSNCLPQKMHSHTGCICGIPLCVSNVSSNGLRWWNANRPSLRKI